MELKWLEDFLSLAQTKSFSKSAEERNVTQPSFSRRIKALELWMGVALIDRSTFPTNLTAEGRRFRETAQEVVRLIYQDRDEFRDQQRKTQASLSFTALHTLSLTFFPAWIMELEAQLGPLNTRLRSENLHDCVQSLVDGDCDFLLSYAHSAVPILLDPGLYPSIAVSGDRLMPVSVPDSGGAPRYRLPGSAGAPLPYLSYSTQHFLGRVEEHILERNDQRLHLVRKYENPMAEALKAMALAGHGVAWLPRSSIDLELGEGRLVPAGDDEWEMPMEVRVYRSTEKTRPLVEVFWNFVKTKTVAE